MKSTTRLTGLYVACELIANTTATKPVALPGGIVVPAAVFIYALTFISSAENKTVPVGAITELITFDVYNWGGLMAGAMLGSLPVAILYSFFVEHYVSSMTGAVKE